MAQLIDGKLISQQIKDELKEEVAQFFSTQRTRYRFSCQ